MPQRPSSSPRHTSSRVEPRALINPIPVTPESQERRPIAADDAVDFAHHASGAAVASADAAQSGTKVLQELITIAGAHFGIGRAHTRERMRVAAADRDHGLPRAGAVVND